MQQTYNAVIADTSCFILLDKIGTFDILHQLFKEVITSLEVVKEFGKPLPYWIKVVQVKNENLLNQLIFE